jgi:plasmid stabilization system protein ParE
MKRHVSQHELAEFELIDAADYYDSKQPGLGRSFILEVKQAVSQITEHPESAEVLKGSARRKVLKRFPYSLIYSLTPDTIRILAIASHRRRPFYWRGRV